LAILPKAAVFTLCEESITIGLPVYVIGRCEIDGLLTSRAEADLPSVLFSSEKIGLVAGETSWMGDFLFLTFWLRIDK